MKRIFTTFKEKWPEYLLEILVLIIGIYGAFAVDRWNEKQSNKKLVEDYYCRFLADLNQDAIKINDLLAESQLRLAKSNQMLLELQEESPQKNKAIKLMLEGTARISYQFTPISAGYDDLKSSGNLNTFTDQGIIDQLGTYLKETEGLAGNISYNGQTALTELFEIDDLFSIGFIDNSFLKEGIDTTLIKLETFDRNPLTSVQQKQLKHMSTVLIALNFRNSQHYQLMLDKNQLMKPLIESKCTNP